MVKWVNELSAKWQGWQEALGNVLWHSKEEKLIVDLMTQASSTKVFSHIHSKADIHGYRAVYASKLYKRYARPIESLERAEKYICRKDKAGIVYDRRAMKIVSKQLGHERISVIANSYLHNA